MPAGWMVRRAFYFYNYIAVESNEEHLAVPQMCERRRPRDDAAWTAE